MRPRDKEGERVSEGCKAVENLICVVLEKTWSTGQLGLFIPSFQLSSSPLRLSGIDPCHPKFPSEHRRAPSKPRHTASYRLRQIRHWQTGFMLTALYATCRELLPTNRNVTAQEKKGEPLVPESSITMNMVFPGLTKKMSNSSSW